MANPSKTYGSTPSASAITTACQGAGLTLDTTNNLNPPWTEGDFYGVNVAGLTATVDMVDPDNATKVGIAQGVLDAYTP
jgi:hypothetical protein